MRFRHATTAALLLAAVPAAGQESPLPDLFADVIDVRVVNVEVVVTDKKGNRIRGLQASDFELRVDGAPVPIDYFTEIDDGLAKTSSDDGVGNVPALAVDEPVGTNYLIFIDDYFSFQRDRDRVLGHLEKDLVQLGPRDRVAIVASDGVSLALLVGWTNSAAEIQEALREARERPALGLMRLSDRRKLAEASSRLEIDYQKRILTEQIEQSVLAAVATLRSFASREGRKVMLVLAGGWGLPQYSVYDLPTMIDITTVLGPLANAANRVGYTLYPVDVPGFRGASEWEEHNSLRYLAEETGGVVMINAQRTRALAETAADTRSYYWLGFEPPRNEDDENHDVRVRVVGRRDLRVRARRSYRDMSRNTEVTMLVEGALIFGGSPGVDTLSVRLGTPERTRSRKILVPIEVTIPLHHVQLLPVAGRWTNELEFRVTVIDDVGGRSETPVEKILISGTREPQPGDFFTYKSKLRLRGREHRFVAAVYDPVSGAILSSSGTVGTSRRPDRTRGVPN